MTDFGRTGSYALGEDLAKALWTNVAYIRWAASKYGWRKVRIGRQMRYHVEDAWRDLGPGQTRRWEKIVDEWLDHQKEHDTPEVRRVLDWRSRSL